MVSVDRKGRLHKTRARGVSKLGVKTKRNESEVNNMFKA